MAEISSEFTRALGSKLAQSEPLHRIARETAAVAFILRIDLGRGDEFLLIKRAERAGDPWSGQVAFPGGRVEPDDASFEATATRETREEVGFDLSADAEFLGYMVPFVPRNRRIQVVPTVFRLTSAVEVLPSQEVSSYRWIPVAELLSRKNRAEYATEGGSPATVPSFEFGDYVVWGLTERILTGLLEITGVAPA